MGKERNEVGGFLCCGALACFFSSHCRLLLFICWCLCLLLLVRCFGCVWLVLSVLNCVCVGSFVVAFFLVARSSRHTHACFFFGRCLSLSCCFSSSSASCCMHTIAGSVLSLDLAPCMYLATVLSCLSHMKALPPPQQSLCCVILSSISTFNLPASSKTNASGGQTRGTVEQIVPM